MALDGLL